MILLGGFLGKIIINQNAKKEENNESPFYLYDEDTLKHLITNDMCIVQIPFTVYKQEVSQPVSSNQALPSIEEIAENQNKNPIVKFFGIHFREAPEVRAYRQQAEHQQKERNRTGTFSKITKKKSGDIIKQFEITQKTRALLGGGTRTFKRSLGSLSS